MFGGGGGGVVGSGSRCMRATNIDLVFLLVETRLPPHGQDKSALHSFYPSLLHSFLRLPLADGHSFFSVCWCEEVMFFDD